MKVSSLRGSGVALASALRKPRTSASDIARVLRDLLRGLALAGRVVADMRRYVAQARGAGQGFAKHRGTLHSRDGSTRRGQGERNAVRGGDHTAPQPVAARTAHPDRGDLPAEWTDRATLLVHRS